MHMNRTDMETVAVACVENSSYWKLVERIEIMTKNQVIRVIVKLKTLLSMIILAKNVLYIAMITVNTVWMTLIPSKF